MFHWLLLNCSSQFHYHMKVSKKSDATWTCTIARHRMGAHQKDEGQENQQHSWALLLVKWMTRSTAHKSNSKTLTYEGINYWTDLFKTDIFRRLMIQHRWQSRLFLFSPQNTVFCDKKVNIMNRQSHLKQRPRKAIILHVLPLASTWGRNVNFNVFYTI